MNIDTPIGENGLQMNAVHEIHTLSGSLSLPQYECFCGYVQHSDKM